MNQPEPHHHPTSQAAQWTCRDATASPGQQRFWMGLALGVALVLPVSAMAQADDAAYPSKPVKLIVSYAAGNVTDSLARVVAAKLAEKWGQGVLVDNRPGQGGSVGAQLGAKSPADGYTLLFSAMAAMAINPHLYANVGYDVQKDFIPIVNIAYPNSVMVASPGLKINNLADLVSYSKANPTALNYGTAGNGTVPHLNMESLKARTGLVAQHVPYKAASAVMTDVMAGRLQLQQEAISVVMPQIKAGKLTPIAAGTVKRIPQLPDLPTLSEVVPGYVPIVPWLGIFAPTGTPQSIVNKVYQDVTSVVQSPEVQQRLQSIGLIMAGESTEQFAKLIAFDHERLGKLVKELGLKVD